MLHLQRTVQRNQLLRSFNNKTNQGHLNNLSLDIKIYGTLPSRPEKQHRERDGEI